MKRAELRALVVELRRIHPEVTIKLHPRLVVPDPAHPRHKFFQVDLHMRGITSSFKMENFIEIGECHLAFWVERESALLQHLAHNELDFVIRAMRVIQSADPGRVEFARRYVGLPVSALPRATPTTTSRPPTQPADPLPGPTLWDRLTDDSEP